MIIDSHVHLYVNQTPEHILALADRAGFERVFVSHTMAVGFDMAEGNGRLAQAMRRYPERILGYVAISSSRYRQAAMDEVVRGAEVYGMRGLKLLHRVAGSGSYTLITPLDEPWMYPIVARAAELGLIVLAHAAPQEVEGLAREVPEAKIIMAHSGGCPTAWGDWHRAIMAAERYPNILLDTASSMVDMGYIEAMVEAVGPERVVFGTDMPLLDPFAQKSKVIDADLDEEAKALIMGGNMARLLGLKAEVGS